MRPDWQQSALIPPVPPRLPLPINSWFHLYPLPCLSPSIPAVYIQTGASLSLKKEHLFTVLPQMCSLPLSGFLYHSNERKSIYALSAWLWSPPTPCLTPNPWAFSLELWQNIPQNSPLTCPLVHPAGLPNTLPFFFHLCLFCIRFSSHGWGSAPLESWLASSLWRIDPALFQWK